MQGVANFCRPFKSLPRQSGMHFSLPFIHYARRPKKSSLMVPIENYTHTVSNGPGLRRVQFPWHPLGCRGS